jgi:hypothetical protein
MPIARAGSFGLMLVAGSAVEVPENLVSSETEVQVI